LNCSKSISFEINSGILSFIKESITVQSEQELIQGCLHGKRESQDILYKKYSPIVYGICLRYSKNHEEARDLMHDSFIKVFTGFKTFRSDSSVKTWISRITVNHVINHLKRKVLKNINNDIYELNVVDEDSLDKYDDRESEINISTEDLLTLFQYLPDGYRTILNLFAIEKYSHKEIALTLGISENTSKSQLFKARKMLKELLNKYIIKCKAGIK
jgi:RNA polymerase sigma factor (sigma-70 family)